MERIGNKCEHGVYWPVADPINLGCQQCNPTGYLNEGPALVVAESAPVVVSTNCTRCGNVRTYSSPNCRVCGQQFPERVYENYQSTMTEPGTCPFCGCASHFETTKKSMWQCTDCLKEFRAPKTEETDDNAE